MEINRRGFLALFPGLATGLMRHWLPASNISGRPFVSAPRRGRIIIGLPPFAESAHPESPSSPHTRGFDFSTLSSWIVPTAEFYVRNHFEVPDLAGSRALIEIRGAVRSSAILDLATIKSLPEIEQAVTLECAGNFVGGGGVSNAMWSGIALGGILREAGIPPDAKEVVLVGADGGLDETDGIKVTAFARGIPIEMAMKTILALRMNGEPLPAVHGGPIRAIVPGCYGMDSVKWLSRIVVSTEPFAGFYQTRRYYSGITAPDGKVVTSPLHEMLVKSQIARPRPGDVLNPGLNTILGAAWSGNARITEVDVSVDGGRSWRKATLAPENRPSAWRLWRLDWNAAQGRYEIISVATDDKGRRQSLSKPRSLAGPYANNWADRHIVSVRQ